MVMNTCTECSYRGGDTEAFCPRCGHPLVREAGEPYGFATDKLPTWQVPTSGPHGETYSDEANITRIGMPAWHPQGAYLAERTQETSAGPLTPAHTGRSRSGRSKARRRYVSGLVVGILPLVLYLVGYAHVLGVNTVPTLSAFASGTFLTASLAGCTLYLVECAIAAVCILPRRARAFGWGMSTMLLLDPLIALLAALMAPSLTR